jgi:cellulose synthase/poly-beta-1,6-N-acetylglucosamine synthase-like glycosyltransferase
VTSPAELPPEMVGFKSQQHRWAKGGAQTCRKLLPTIMKSNLPWRIKVEAFFHLTSWVSYLLMVMLTVLLFPAFFFKAYVFQDNQIMRFVVDASLVLLATFSASTFYVASQRELFRTWAESVKYLPFLMAIGVGISLNNARAALEGFFGGQSEFVRTPKFGMAESGDRQWKKKSGENKLDPKRVQGYCELLMGLYMGVCVLYTASQGMWLGLVFMCLFTVGYLYVAGLTFLGQHQSARAQAQAALEHASSES